MNIELAKEFDNAETLLIVAISGTPLQILDQLYILYQEAAVRKPSQGIYMGGYYTTQIITPVWNGKKC